MKKLQLSEKAEKYLKRIATIISSLTIIITTLFGAVHLGISAALSATNQKIDIITEKAETLEEDMVRTQLLLLIKDDSDNKSAILKLAKKYFVELCGDWYMSEMFAQWAEDNNIHTEILNNRCSK